MPKTKSQWNGRGRPAKWFTLIKERKLNKDETNKTTVRGRPKKVRKIDDSINTKIDMQRKSVAQLAKANKEIEKNLGDYKLESKSLDEPNLSLENSKPSRNKGADNFSLIILICAMLFFIFALGKTFLYKTTLAEIRIHELTNNQSTVTADEIWEQPEYLGWDYVELSDEENINTDNNDNSDDVEIWINNEITENNLDTDIQSNDHTIIYNFYKYINDLDYTNINSSVDKYLKSSDVFKTYFTQNRLSRFKEKISSNGLSINNIHLVSWDENSTRYYSYTVHYELAENGENFDEDRELAIVKRNGEYLIGSIRCVTTWCSKMPFFQK